MLPARSGNEAVIASSSTSLTARMRMRSVWAIGVDARQALPHVDRSETVAAQRQRDLAAVEGVVCDEAHQHRLTGVDLHPAVPDAALLARKRVGRPHRSEEHTAELQS